MNDVEWTTKRGIFVGEYRIPVAEGIHDQCNQVAGIRTDTKRKLILKTLFWPLVKLRDDLLVDGFIERDTGKVMKEFLSHDTVFVDIGCGDMSLMRYLSRHITYNAFDLSLSEFHVRRVMRKRNRRVNIALASATNIPVESNRVTMMVCTEVLPFIPDIQDVLSELNRIAVPGAILITSIPNNLCRKYSKKGPHSARIHDWTYREFIDLMDANGFKFLKGHMNGWWIPLPKWLTKTSYQLPVSSQDEYMNTNFIHVFRAEK
jgi:SAM-dependent methyltransferase